MEGARRMATGNLEYQKTCVSSLFSGRAIDALHSLQTPGKKETSHQQWTVCTRFGDSSKTLDTYCHSADRAMQDAAGATKSDSGSTDKAGRLWAMGQCDQV